MLNQNILLDLLLLGLFTGIFSGIYPAILPFQPFVALNVLNGDHGLARNSGLARKVLVVIQFTISISLIIGTMVIFNQLNYLKNAQLGFNKENIIVVPVNSTPVARSYEAFSKELLQDSQILSVTAMDDIFGLSSQHT